MRGRVVAVPPGPINKLQVHAIGQPFWGECERAFGAFLVGVARGLLPWGLIDEDHLSFAGLNAVLQETPIGEEGTVTIDLGPNDLKVVATNPTARKYVNLAMSMDMEIILWLQIEYEVEGHGGGVLARLPFPWRIVRNAWQAGDDCVTEMPEEFITIEPPWADFP